MSERWSRERAWSWYRQQPWLVGCNFIPSTAINQLEMWQAASFDPETIDRELGWARGIGFNTARVYLHDLLWQADEAGFIGRISKFLDIAARHQIRPMFVIFDDCWNPVFQLGEQPAPRPGVHNSGWLQSPGNSVNADPSQWGRLADYVGGLVSAFANDERILLWDLYNEPGNSKMGVKSIALMRAAFAWARQANPRQPLSVGIWDQQLAVNAVMLANSDVITFHNYNGPGPLEAQILSLQAFDRPLICTEWMARTRGSGIAGCLPVFKRYRVGCLNWGLVSGKTQTIYSWAMPPGGREPEVWFHDIFRPDGTPYNPAETALFRSLTEC